jgi:glucose-6-phosphate 1-dehydrogenase
MIASLVLFGASGDLAGRYLLPALAALHAANELPETFAVLGTARDDWDDTRFQRHARARLDEHAQEVPAAAREQLIRGLRYRRVDLGDPRSVAEVIRAAGAHAVAAYLALPPGLFPPTIEALREAGLPPGSRLAVEKPFGEDLRSAVELNALLAEFAGEAGEDAVFRVDHVLGMATVQNLLALRTSDGVLESLWNSEHIAEVEVLWEETLALEGRAGYYDGAGALEDVMQNHMLQVLCVLAMEPPAGPAARELQDAKVNVLRAARIPGGDVTRHTRRGRYGAGLIGDRRVPAYVDEEGVDPDRCTETFAEVELEVDTPRWRGTRFVLRAGKALGERHKEAVVRFRGTGADADVLRAGIDGPTDLALRLSGVTLSAPPPASDVPAYGHVLLDLLGGGSALSVGGDEAEQAWRVVEPVVAAWREGVVPLEEYPAGSAGPDDAASAREPSG